MTLNIALAFFTATIMLSSNLVNKPLQENYELETGKSWFRLTLISWLLSGIDGSLAAYITQQYGNSYDIMYLTILGSVITFLAVQTLFTDISILQGDRWTLRIGYVISIALSFIYVYTEYSGPVQTVELFTLGLLLAALFILFIFSPIGASDVRALAVMFPLPMVINTGVAAYSFIGVMVFAMIVQTIWQHQAKAKIPVPVLPFFLLPYVFFIPTFSVLLNLQSGTLFR